MKTKILTPKETSILASAREHKKDLKWIKLNHPEIYRKIK